LVVEFQVLGGAVFVMGMAGMVVIVRVGGISVGVGVVRGTI
jgi:hypothetical protein